MEKEGRLFNCRRLDSYTSPCPHRDNETLQDARSPVILGIPTTIPSDLFERAEQICQNCDSFIPIKRRK